MSWAKVDDGLPNHPRTALLLALDGGWEALGAWVLTLAWANQGPNIRRDPGFIPAPIVVRFGITERMTATLLESGHWEAVDGGYQICNFAEHRGGYWPWEKEFRRKVPLSIRDAVFRRDGSICQACDSARDLTLDHIIPYSCGGPDTVDNLRVLCRSCNSSRGAGRW